MYLHSVIHILRRWAGMLLSMAALSSVVGVFKESFVKFTIFLSICSIATSIAGVVIDSRAFVKFNSYAACTQIPNSKTGGFVDDDTFYEFWGDANYYTPAYWCATYAGVDVFSPNTCYCASNDNVCGNYKLNSYSLGVLKHNCGNLLTTFPDITLASTVLCSIIVSFSVVLCLMSVGVTYCYVDWPKREDEISKYNEYEIMCHSFCHNISSFAWKCISTVFSICYKSIKFICCRLFCQTERMYNCCRQYICRCNSNQDDKDNVLHFSNSEIDLMTCKNNTNDILIERNQHIDSISANILSNNEIIRLYGNPHIRDYRIRKYEFNNKLIKNSNNFTIDTSSRNNNSMYYHRRLSKVITTDIYKPENQVPIELRRKSSISSAILSLTDHSIAAPQSHSLMDKFKKDYSLPLPPSSLTSKIETSTTEINHNDKQLIIPSTISDTTAESKLIELNLNTNLPPNTDDSISLINNQEQLLNNPPLSITNTNYTNNNNPTYDVIPYPIDE